MESISSDKHEVVLDILQQIKESTTTPAPALEGSFYGFHN